MRYDKVGCNGLNATYFEAGYGGQTVKNKKTNVRKAQNQKDENERREKQKTDNDLIEKMIYD